MTRRQKREEAQPKPGTDLVHLAAKIARHVVSQTSATFDDLDDVTQAALVGLCEAVVRDDNTRPETFDAYAIKRMYGAARDYVYRDKRLFGLGVGSDAQLVEYTNGTGCETRTPERIAAAREAIRRLDELPDRDRQLIEMLYLTGVSWGDTKRALKIGSRLMLAKVNNAKAIARGA